MEKRMYNAPKITILEIETTSMIAASDPQNTVTSTSEGGVNVEFNQGTVTEEDGNSARIGSRLYFDSWNEE